MQSIQPKKYRKLRSLLFDCDITYKDLAAGIGKSPSYISERMVGSNARKQWTIKDMYAICDFVNAASFEDKLPMPYNEIHIFFPPNGGVSEKLHGRSA